MAWFRNLTTGLRWEVSGELADRLAADPNYQAEDMPVAEPEAETPKARRRKPANQEGE